jgi:hypothetical protein
VSGVEHIADVIHWSAWTSASATHTGHARESI